MQLQCCSAVCCKGADYPFLCTRVVEYEVDPEHLYDYGTKTEGVANGSQPWN